jgi:hypothetical protein
MHDNTKIRVLQALLEMAKYCYKNGNVKLQYVLDDMSQVVFDVDGPQFNEAEYAIMVGNAVNDARAIAMLEEATKIALQTGAVDILQMLDVHSNDSQSSIRRKLERSIKEKQQQASQAQQAEAKQLEADRQMQLQLKQQEMELEKYKIDTTNQTKIMVEEMKAFGMDEGSNSEDISAVADRALKSQELQHKAFMEANKQAQEVQTKQQELQLKREEIASKKEVENQKLKQIEVQNANQIQLAKEKAKNDKANAEAKMRIEQMKARAAISKSKSK